MSAFSVFPYFTLVSKDDARLAICVGGSIEENVSWSQQIPDHRLDDTRLMQSHVFDERPVAFDVSISVSAMPDTSAWDDWNFVCDTLGFVKLAPTTRSGSQRVSQVLSALRSERRRVWTVYSARYGVLEGYMIVTCSHAFGNTLGSEVKLSMKPVEFATAESVYLAPPTPRARAARETPRPDLSQSELTPEDYYSEDPHAEDGYQDILGHMLENGRGMDDLTDTTSSSFFELFSVPSVQ